MAVAREERETECWPISSSDTTHTHVYIKNRVDFWCESESGKEEDNLLGREKERKRERERIADRRGGGDIEIILAHTDANRGH